MKRFKLKAVVFFEHHYINQIPGARHSLIQGAAHLTMQDAPEQELKAINIFLKDIEK
jgi:hypothetical protein